MGERSFKLFYARPQVSENYVVECLRLRISAGLCQGGWATSVKRAAPIVSFEARCLSVVCLLNERSSAARRLRCEPKKSEILAAPVVHP